MWAASFNAVEMRRKVWEFGLDNRKRDGAVDRGRGEFFVNFGLATASQRFRRGRSSIRQDAP